MAIHHKHILRVLLFVLLAAVILWLIFPIFSAETKYSEKYASGIFCRRLKNAALTGNQRTDIVNVALSQIGYSEGDNGDQISGHYDGSKNYTEYGLWYNGLQEEPGGFEKAFWCAMFVSWCAYQADIPADTVYYHAYTVYGLNWFTEHSQVYTRQQVEQGEYIPQPGDIVYFKSSRNGDKVNHVGIVVRYEDGILYAVEGNSNDTAHSTNGGQVCLKSYQITDTFIRYICCPDYSK